VHTQQPAETTADGLADAGVRWGAPTTGAWHGTDATHVRGFAATDSAEEKPPAQTEAETGKAGGAAEEEVEEEAVGAAEQRDREQLLSAALTHVVRFCVLVCCPCLLVGVRSQVQCTASQATQWSGGCDHHTQHRHVALYCCLMPAHTSAPDRLSLPVSSGGSGCARTSSRGRVCGLMRRCGVHGTQPRLGWSVQALWAGAEDVGVSAAAVGILPRGEAMLVEWHEHCCTAAVARRLADEQSLLLEMSEPERIQVRHLTLGSPCSPTNVVAI
jgi:hypothetical protein